MTKRRRALDQFLVRAGRLLGDRLRDDAEACAAVAADESGEPLCPPAAVAWPNSSAEIAELCKEAAARDIGLVPRGAGTGKAGGCIPRSMDIVIDLSRMNSILELHSNDLYAVVQPGVITADLDEAAGEQGLFYPPDPGSRESRTLGGNIATNAGGPRAVKYGCTIRYVWGLELVLASGEIIRTGRRSLKGVAGYNITELMVGSEGTLAFVSAATLHLLPAPRDVQTAWLTFESLSIASHAGAAIFAAGILPRMMELLDAEAMRLVRPVSEFRIPEGGAALLVEVDGDDDQTLPLLTRLCEIAVQAGAGDTVIATRERDRLAMRRARQLVSSCMKEAFPAKISDDVAVPRSRMAELIERAAELAADAGLPFSAYGHLGDGNLHVNLLCDEGSRAAAEQTRERILRQVVAMQGTISGEHGLGTAKRHLLSLEQTPELMVLQQNIKSLLDPNGILNPGKVW